MVQDISNAYFFAPATRDIFIELPPEDAEPGMVGKLEKSLYGTRDAALNWAEAYTKVLIAMGYEKGTSSPCSFHHAEWDVSTVVHGDDFLREGPMWGLDKMNSALAASFQVKTEIIGPDPGQQLEARVLNRVIRWEDTGITWEPDPRHAEIMVEQMGFNGGRPLKIPGVTEEKKIDRELRADINHIISEDNCFDMNMNPDQNEINRRKHVGKEEMSARRQFVAGAIRSSSRAASPSGTLTKKDMWSAVMARRRTSSISTGSPVAGVGGRRLKEFVTTTN